MKIMNYTIKIILLFFLMGNMTTYAQLKIDSYANTSNNNCNGKITISGNADTAPFSITIAPVSDPQNSKTLSGIQGNTNAKFTDLCAGTYKISAVNRFGCKYVLENLTLTNEGGGGGNTDFRIDANKKSGEKGLEVVFSVTNRPSGSLKWNVSPNFLRHQFINSAPNSLYPKIRFEDPGTYTVWLEIEGQKSNEISIVVKSSSKITANMEIKGDLFVDALIEFKDRSIHDPSCPGFKNSNWIVTEYPKIGQPDIKNKGFLPIMTHAFIHEGEHTVRLEISDACGNTDAITKAVKVTKFKNSITASFIADKYTIYEGETITFTDNSYPKEKIIYYSWYFELDEDVQDANRPGDLFMLARDYKMEVKHTYHKPGTYKVRLLVDEHASFPGVYKDVIIKVLPKILNHDELVDIELTARSCAIWDLDKEYFVIVSQRCDFYGTKYLLIYKKGGAGWAFLTKLKLDSKDFNIINDLDINDDKIVLSTKKIGGNPHIVIFERNGSEWGSDAIMSEINISSYSETDVNYKKIYAKISGNTVVAVTQRKSSPKTLGEIFVFEKNSNGWPGTYSQVISIEKNHEIKKIAFKGNTVVALIKDRAYAVTRSSNGNWSTPKKIELNYFRSWEDIDVNNFNEILLMPEYSNTKDPLVVGYVFQESNGVWNNVNKFRIDNKAIKHAKKLKYCSLAKNYIAITGIVAYDNNEEVPYTYIFKKSGDTWEDELFVDFSLNDFKLEKYGKTLVSGNYAVQSYPGSKFMFYDLDKYTCNEIFEKTDAYIGGGIPYQYPYSMEKTVGYAYLGGGNADEKFIVNSTGNLKIKASETVLKPGFIAENRSNVILTSMNCEGFTKSAMSNMALDINEEVNEKNTSSLKVHPNPVKNELHIQSSSIIHSIMIFDITGRPINKISGINASSYTFHNINYPSGMYFIKIITDEEMIEKKILIE